MPSCCVPWPKLTGRRRAAPQVRAQGVAEKAKGIPQANLGERSLPGPSGWQDAKNTAVNGLMIALRVTKEATPFFPPLQSAVGGLLAIAEVVQKVSSNKDGVETLVGYVDKLNMMVATTLPPNYDSCPTPLKERLADFDMRVKAVAQEVQKLEARALPAQLLNADDTADRIEECIRSLSWLIQCLTVQGTISIELAVDELHIVIRRGFDHMDERFDGLSDQIGGVSDQIAQLRSDATHGLRYTYQAAFDYHQSGRSQCEANTRLDALATVYSWLRPNDPRLSGLPAPLCVVHPESPVFWINGLAGTGKSTLAQTIAQRCENVGFLGASFFCARDGERSNVQLIFPTIAHQLGSICAPFRQYVSEAVKANPDIHGSLVSRQLQKLIVEPLRAVKENGLFPECTIVIDALDECKDDEAVSVILRALSSHVSAIAPLKFVITSRPVQQVTSGFRLRELVQNTQHFSLSMVPVENTKRDIALFLRNRLSFIREHYYIDGYWPSDEQVDALVELASELFIFAATAVKFVGDQQANDPERQLNLLLNPPSPSAIPISPTSPYNHLDALYTQVLKSAFPKVDRPLRANIKIVLGTIALAQEQLSPGALEALLHLTSGTVRRTLRQTHSIIIVPPTDEEVIRVIHRSFADFITDASRCVEADFRVNPPIQHTVIAKHCLQTLLLLQRNICRISDEALLNVEVPGLNERLAKYIPPNLKYSCKYWSYHLCLAEPDQEILDALDSFCRTHLLHWLEALSLLGCVDEAIQALQSARETLEKLPIPPTDVPTLLYDCERLVRSAYPAISASCFQVYQCALPFSPTRCLLRQCYMSQAPNTVQLRSGMEESWSPNTVSIEAHARRVQAVAYSPNGQRIVSCSEDATIKLWDARTGARLHVLEGHTARVCCVVFSPSGKELLSSSDDLTVKLWDATTGKCLGSWTRHTHDVRSVAWSPDGNYAASGSYDRKVILWPVASPEAATIFTEHTAEVDGVTFAPETSCLQATTKPAGCGMWRASNASVPSSIQLASLRFSPDGTHIVTGECANSVRIWQCNLRQQQSKESKRLFGYQAKDRGIWEPSTGTYRSTGGHHASTVRVVSFSPDGSLIATAAWDGTVRLWDAATGTRSKLLAGHEYLITSVAWARSGRFLVSTGDRDHHVVVWDVRTGERVKTFKGHTGGVWVALFTDDERQIVSCSDDGTIRLWTIEGSKLGAAASPGILYQGNGPVYTMTMSLDSHWILSGTLDFIQPEPPHALGIGLTAPSRKPTRVAGLVRGAWEETYGYPTLRLHDAAGHVLWVENHGSMIASLAFSQDCTRALSGSQDGRIFLYDLTVLVPSNDAARITDRMGPANVLIHEFEVGDGKPVEHVSFSVDERAVVSDASYTHLEPPLWPKRAHGSTSSSSSPVYFLLDGWLWRAVPQLRRVCWVPPAFRHFRDGATAWRGNMDTCGDLVAFGTIHGKLVTLDLSDC
ncbi:hypothetical protein C8Q73DRAFT_794488 [Cubamyces lactineus]|nr:hypothetical protein C8Q73DRAFT_794488 [Cubamyces lactineus]